MCGKIPASVADCGVRIQMPLETHFAGTPLPQLLRLFPVGH